jgi:hypothetical protein
MKKQLNVEGITSELRGQSAFFPSYKKEAAAKPAKEPSRKPDDATNDALAPVPPVRVVPPVRPTSPAKRVMKQRHPFDIYQDQYEALQQLALEERKQGGIGSMSAMVREAIDALVAKRRGK